MNFWLFSENSFRFLIPASLPEKSNKLILPIELYLFLCALAKGKNMLSQQKSDLARLIQKIDMENQAAQWALTDSLAG
jgi:hypothetical protein